MNKIRRYTDIIDHRYYRYLRQSFCWYMVKHRNGIACVQMQSTLGNFNFRAVKTTHIDYFPPISIA